MLHRQRVVSNFILSTYISLKDYNIFYIYKLFTVYLTFSANVACPGAFEMFSPCGDDGCQKSCRRPDTTGCVSVCRLSGCICIQGYVRNDAGTCVLANTCREYILYE